MPRDLGVAVAFALALRGLVVPAAAWAGAPLAGTPAAPAEPAAAESVPARELVPSDPWATFSYVPDASSYRLRLAIEELSMAGIAFIGYLIQDPPPAVEGVPSTTMWEKLTFAPGSWYLDADTITTNFVGHPVGGTLYYMVARSNRVPIWEAFLWTVGTSTLWEFLEFKEPVSINDMVVTPTAGLAIGEAFTQLSGWFDRSSPSGTSKALAWLFNPPKKLHDWIDKATPHRDPAFAGWHEFQVRVGAGLVRQGGVAYPAFQVDLFTRLFRAAGYGEAGGTGFGFADGNVSRIDLSSTFSAGTVVEFLFDTETALVGWYTRNLEQDSDGLHGWDFFVGGTAGYEFGSHVWNLEPASKKNQIAMVRVPGLDLRARAFAGPFELTFALDVALDFGGVEPLEAPPPDAPPQGLSYPTVYPVQGYYFALGLHVAPFLELRLGPAALGVAVRTDWLRSLDGPFVPSPPDPVLDFADDRLMGSAWFRLRADDPSVELTLRGAWWSRWSAVEGARASAQQRALFLTFAVVL